MNINILNRDSNYKELLFSIIIPAYNSMNYIKRCLDSIYKQKFNINYFEVILVNDGSTDDLLNWVSNYQNDYENFLVINQRNKSAGGARNSGIRRANGKYIIFLDSDDLMCHENTLELLRNILNDINCDFVYNPFYTKYLDEKLSQTFYEESLINYYYIDNNEIISKSNFNLASWSYIINREFLISNSLFFRENVYYEDTDFVFKLTYYGKKIIHLNLNYYGYCNNLNSITRVYNKKSYIDNCSGLISAKNFIDDIVHGKIYINKYMNRLKPAVLSYLRISINYELVLNLEIFSILKSNNLLNTKNYNLTLIEFILIFLMNKFPIFIISLYKLFFKVKFKIMN